MNTAYCLQSLQPYIRKKYTDIDLSIMRRYLSETSGIELPVRVIDVAKLERQNNFSINVYMLHLMKGKLIVHCTDNEKDNHFDLLYFQDYYLEEQKQYKESNLPPPRAHHAWIKNCSRLVSSQITHDRRKSIFVKDVFHFTKFGATCKVQRRLFETKSVE